MSSGQQQSATYEHIPKAAISSVMLCCQANNKSMKIIEFVNLLEVNICHLANTRAPRMKRVMKVRFHK